MKKINKDRLTSFLINLIVKYGREQALKMFAEMAKILKVEGTEVNCDWYQSRVYDEGYMHLSKEERYQMIKSGQIKTKLEKETRNKILLKLTDSIIAHHMGANGASENLAITQLALGSGDSKVNTGIPPVRDNESLNRERTRSTPTEVYKSDATLVVTLYLDSATANLENTTIASVASATVFTVQSGKGALFEANDKIRVFLDDYQSVTVDSVDGDEITLKALTPLSRVPDVGAVVERMYAECALYAGGATSSPGDGTPLNHASLEFAKKSDNSVLIEVHLNYITAA